MPGRLVRCLVQYSPKPAWSHALSGSCNLGHFLSWTRMIPFTATMRPIVPAVGRGNERPAGCPTRLAPAPRTPTRTGLAPRTGPLRPSDMRPAPGHWPLRQRTHAPTWPWPLPSVPPDPRGARPAGTKIFQAQPPVCTTLPL